MFWSRGSGVPGNRITPFSRLYSAKYKSHVPSTGAPVCTIRPRYVNDVSSAAPGDGRCLPWVLTGDVRQIDTPYLDARSNGLAYLTDRPKGHELFAHVTLEKGERSELANLASELL